MQYQKFIGDGIGWLLVKDINVYQQLDCYKTIDQILKDSSNVIQFNW